MPAPWKKRGPRPVTVKRRWNEGGTLYHLMSDGSIRNPEHPRHERKALALTPRQHRRIAKAVRRGKEIPAALRSAA